MRDIKFRAKRISDGEWVYGVPVESVNGRFYFIHGATEDAINTPNQVDFYFCEVDPKTVGQLVGLKDKNGKEIYEGDIIAGCNGSINGRGWIWKPQVIVWDNETAEFNVPLWGTDKHHDSTHYFEVIGNIHENPELLEEKK